MKRLIKVWLKPAASLLGLALFLAAGASVSAQQANPDTRAARLSYVEGEVQLMQGNQLLANPALANTPLFEGCQITTKDDGRAEVQFDDGSVVRLSPNSSIRLTVLRQEGGLANGEVVLENGLAYFEMQGDTSTNRMTARFGDSAVTASGFTVLRIDNDNPPGELAVFTGNAHLQRGGALSLDLRGGESVALNANDPNQYNLAETIEPNSWDAWNADRDQELSSEQAAKTAASGSQPNGSNPAWGDLDANGQWYNVPGEGYVWSPYEASSGDWDPYGCGSWVWNPQFGYTWVSCESWGYLPYNCGYWNFYDGFGWGWVPGYGYPWWTTGGWVINVGTRPHRYEPPHRPHGGPVRPPSEPIHRVGIYQPNPVVGVNRIPRAPVANPVHPVGRPVTIAGSTVEPLRPLSPRPIYNPPAAPGAGRTFHGSSNPGSVNPGYVVNPRPGNPSTLRYGVPAATPRYGVPTPTPRYGNPANGNPGYNPWANSGGSSHPGVWTAPAAPSGGTYRAPVAPSHGPVVAPSRPSSGGGVPRASGGGGGARPSGGGGSHVSTAPAPHR